MDKKDDVVKYKKAFSLRVKDFVAKSLKKSAFGHALYPFFQKCWRAYAIPKKRERLQKYGSAAIERLHRLMQLHSIPYYCDYGTLIGFVRDKGFIKHDDDIDISIQPDTVSPVEVLKVFLNAGYGFVHAFDYNGRILEFTVVDVSGITVDVFFSSKASERGKVLGYEFIFDPAREYPSENANTVIEYEYVEAVNVKTMEIVGTSALVPGNYEEVLTSEYGPWEVPDAHYNMVENHAHRELPGYAYRLTKDEAIARTH